MVQPVSAALRLAAVALQAGFRHLRTKSAGVAPVLYTVGYELHPEPLSLAALLNDAGVERLVDVRELPMSRRRGFSKTALGRVVDAYGVVYVHERALGNPKPYRDLYRSGEQARGERLYRSHLRNGASEAVDWLAETLTQQVTCLLCFEHYRHQCHRDAIVGELMARMPSLEVRDL